MSDELATKAVHRVLESVGELSTMWDRSTIDESLQQLLDNVYRDVEDARDHVAAVLATGGD